MHCKLLSCQVTNTWFRNFLGGLALLADDPYFDIFFNCIRRIAATIIYLHVALQLKSKSLYRQSSRYVLLYVRVLLNTNKNLINTVNSSSPCRLLSTLTLFSHIFVSLTYRSLSEKVWMSCDINFLVDAIKIQHF